MDIDVNSLMAQWRRKWSESLLIDRESFNPDQRVRFYSLPDGKRYPETESEYSTILDRHYTILKELDPGDSLLVITSEWTDTPKITSQRWPKRSQVEPSAVHWMTLEEPENDSYRQIFVSQRSWRLGVIDELLRAVANDEMSGVILAPKNFGWLYCPYDGGADVILSTPEERDSLKARHPDWVSKHPKGL